MHTIIYDTSTRAILVTTPQVDAQENPILPQSTTAAVATIADTEFAKFTTAGSSFSLAVDNVTVVVTTVVQPANPLHDAVVATAVSSVGVTLSALTQAQRLALVACLLYRAGALDPATQTVRPLEQWLT